MTTKPPSVERAIPRAQNLSGNGGNGDLVGHACTGGAACGTNCDEIVIVGMACRFPGADDPEQYWLNLLDGSNRCRPVERWPEASAMSAHGGLLEDVSLFDAGFFRISPREARCMDPQQRIMMEVAYHAIENSGAAPEVLRELGCGVFCASLPGDYKFLFAGDREATYSSHAFLGNANAALAGRLSYFFDFAGPSVTVDTACSSSLVALRAACTSIAQGDCEAALVGAVSVFATDEIFRFTRQAEILSSAGRCSAFGAEADGFVPAEGAAALVVMTARRAAEARLNVLGTIAAIGVNHDGTGQGLMAPNPAAQEQLIARTFNNNSISADRVGYVEAHGTGTIVGDRVELAALEGAYARLGAGTPFLGASKAVIGHTLVCSGLAGVIKALKIFEHDLIPAHPIACRAAAASRFTVNDSPVAWPDDKDMISVSAFGFTGTNGHVVLAKPKPVAPASLAPDVRPLLFPFSAATRGALQARLKQFSAFTIDLPADRIEALRTTLTCGREHLKIRAAVVAKTVGELALGLNALLSLPTDQLAGACVGGVETVASARGWQEWLESGRPAPTESAPLHYKPLALPGYPFERKSYWIGTAPAAPTPTHRATPTIVVDTLRTAVATAATAKLLDWVRPTLAGRPMILLPPLNMDASAWTQQVGTLARNGYAPHIATYPGHNGNCCPSEPFDMERLAEEIAAYARRNLGTGPVPVVGWSLGGCLAMTLARVAPEVPSSLILISTAARFGDDVFGRTIELHQEIRRHETYLALVFDTSGERVLQRLGAGASMDVLMRYYGLLSAFDAVSSLDRITQPTLIIHGTCDPVISEEDVAILRKIPGASVVEFGGHGHFVPLTAAREFNDAALAFLTRLDETHPAEL